MKKGYYLLLLLSVGIGCAAGVFFQKNSCDVIVLNRILVPSDVICSAPEGNPDAPITLVEFSDMECPFSKKNSDSIDSLKKKYPDKIKYCFRHFPLSFHEHAPLKAKAVIVADAQGCADEMRRILFQVNPTSAVEQTMSNIAAGMKLDRDNFVESLYSEETETILQNDIRTGRKTGVRSTPTVFINGYLVKGAVGVDVYSRIINKLL